MRVNSFQIGQMLPLLFVPYSGKLLKKKKKTLGERQFYLDIIYCKITKIVLYMRTKTFSGK